MKLQQYTGCSLWRVYVGDDNDEGEMLQKGNLSA